MPGPYLTREMTVYSPFNWQCAVGSAFGLTGLAFGQLYASPDSFGSNEVEVTVRRSGEDMHVCRIALQQ